MKNNTKIKLLGLSATILGLSLTSLTSVSAWGPERTTFTMNTPATYPVFNSITDNPTIGDERDFVRVGEIDSQVTDLNNTVEVIPGRQYLVYVYFHNNASATFNDSAHNHSGVAVGTRMASTFSTVLTPAEQGTISATITANNTNPTAVWDEAYMTTKTDKVLLHYVPGSAKIYNDWTTNGTVMPLGLFAEEGIPIGLTALNGLIPGCEEYHGVVSYVLQAEELGGSIDKLVSKDGTAFSESVNLKPGDEAVFQLTIRNTGDVALTNAVVKDKLPEGLSLVPGSVTFHANASTEEEQLTDDIFGNGYNFGTIGTGNVLYIKYRVKVGENFDCNGTELQNNATLIYDSDQSTGDSKEDSAVIIAKKEDGCEEPEVPLDNCETNPALPECQEKNCKTNPEMEGCQELPNTGPLEIVMAVIIVLGLGGGGYYLYRTRKTLKTVEGTVSGKDAANPKDLEASTNKTQPTEPKSKASGKKE